MNIKCKVKDNTVIVPKYQTNGAAGMDLHAHTFSNPNSTIINDYPEEGLRVFPGQIIKVNTGLFLEIPEGYEAQLRPRSGLALKHGISLVNTPGTIDSDYRGEIAVILINHGGNVFTLGKGDRIAQMVFNKIERAELVLDDNLSETERGTGGFNSTGRK